MKLRPKMEDLTDHDTSMFCALFDEPIGKVLEVGSRDEPVSDWLNEAGFDVTGVDLREYHPEQDMPGVARTRECKYRYIQSDFCNLPSEFIRQNLGTFDVAISLSAIEHFGLGTYGEIPHPFYDVVAMRWIWHFLKDRGCVYLTVPFGGEFIEYGSHWRVYNLEAIHKRLLSDFAIDCMGLAVVGEIGINGKVYHPGEPIDFEIATSHKGESPHISTIIKATKVNVTRIVPEGR